MKCPKCGCEIGNQSVCPFCGGTIYVSTPTISAGDFGARTTAPVHRTRAPAQRTDLERRVRSLETKINLLLVLQCGTFALTLLALVSGLLN